MGTNAINLKSASYDAAGIVNATWDLFTLDGNDGFVARVDWIYGFQIYFIRDAAAISVSIPVQFDPIYKTYTLTMYGLQGVDDTDYDVASQALPISGWPLA